MSRERMAAYLRADAALNAIRRDVASILRSDDLFWTKLRILDGERMTEWGPADRDDLLLFASRLQLTREIYDQGEGVEYETQYRIEEHGDQFVLWQRRDPVPDEYFDGGGVATPLVQGVLSLNVEAYDGEEWWPTWDSDDFGLPYAVRVTVTVPIGDSPGAVPVALETVIPIDRVLPPFDAGEEEEDEEEAAEEGEAGTGEGTGTGGADGSDRGDDAGPGDFGGGGARPGGSGGGARPGGGGGGARPGGGGGRGGPN